ncbi:LysR family transcriptional regulator [Pseudoflavonifractor sp. 60]|uniref:LysR substrate-binding domain-containing protein n=1 Tax=Pseudoflavonifractor sp. 60 TaxID=2304576 RepID=UPI0013710AA4
MDKQMSYVKMVYDQRSFTKAAEKLYISQPSLSAMIKKAETELGTAIFDRSCTPLELTEAGRAYMEYIDATVRNETLLSEKLWDIQNLNKGHIYIGGSNYILSNILPLILQRMIPRYPDITFETAEANSFVLRQMLLSGALDFVIDSSSEEEPSLIYHDLFEEHILLAIPAADPVNQALMEYQITAAQLLDPAQKRRCLPYDLARSALESPFILLKSENDMYQRADAVFRHYKLQPKALIQLDQLNTSLQYTMYGLGCSFVTDTLFRYGRNCPDICLYAIDAPLCRRRLCIVHKKGRYISKAGRLLIQIAQEIFFS